MSRLETLSRLAPTTRICGPYHPLTHSLAEFRCPGCGCAFSHFRVRPDLILFDDRCPGCDGPLEACDAGHL